MIPNGGGNIKAPTYQLRMEENSNPFYHDCREAAGWLADQMKAILARDVKGYSDYLEQENREKLRRPVEYELELLSLGVYFSVYEDMARKAGTNYQRMLRWINRKRGKRNHLHTFYSKLKGIVTLGLLKDPDRTRNIGRQEKDAAKRYSKRCSFLWSGFLTWLDSTGEFSEECVRFFMWRDYMESQSKQSKMQLFFNIKTLTERFQQYIEPRLRKYLGDTESFIEEAEKTYQGREDYLLVIRKPIEYYLNMVGAQVLNRAYREGYRNADLHLIFLPGCMVARKAEECRAEATSMGSRCGACTRDCPVRIITKLAKEYGCEARILYHNSDLMQMSSKASEVEEKTGKATVGVIGVACLLNLISGGLKARRLGMEAQCVVLDYCGCAAHWTENGLVTQLNLEELSRVMSIV